MSRIYCNTNRIKFTDIPEKYAIPRSFKGKQSEVHSAIITYVFDHYRDTNKYRSTVVDALNRLTYCIMQNELPSFDWLATDPIETMPDIDIELVEESLGDFYLTPDSIIWDLSPSDDSFLSSNDSRTEEPYKAKNLVKHENIESAESDTSSAVYNRSLSSLTNVTNKPLHQIKQQQRIENVDRFQPTPKSDLYINSPQCARFDVSKVWISANINGDDLVIYSTIPEIPRCQNDVSVTTNPDIITDQEYMALYPNHVIHTRAQIMYQKHDGLDYDEDIGTIVPVEGFTKDQIVDNIIRYPHLYRLKKRMDDGSIVPFFNSIEVDGKLIPINEIWDSLPESKSIPRDSEFVKEYVIRRYLLEKESGLKHDYNIVGGLEPFLTIFMPPAKYIERGYEDTLSIVKQCVVSRIRYKQSRNPILRRIEQHV